MVTIEEARKFIAAAEKKTIEIKQPMNIAVVDDGGNLVPHVRVDGAWIGSIDISINQGTHFARARYLDERPCARLQSGGQFFGIQASKRTALSTRFPNLDLEGNTE
jgi:uncharacterized protein GlcG (DUF336 family)